jgi:sialate O-acetylesterase
MTKLFIHPQAGPYEFSEVAYEFGKRLRQELRVPVGIIASAMPGSLVAEWMPADEPEKTFDFKQPKERRGRGALYQSMLVGIPPLAIRGVIWYQGESDAQNANYARDLEALIAAWRKRFEQPDMPFYMAQIAQTTYLKGMTHIWEAQAEVAEHTANVYLAPSNDLWDDGGPARIHKDAKTGRPIVAGGDPHPPYKSRIARRLANIALAKSYGTLDREVLGPTYESHEVAGGKIIVHFKHCGAGLKTDDGQPPNWFEVSASANDEKGAAPVFVEAQARIVGKDRVEVWSDQVPAPRRVRFAWHPLARHNLYNEAGLPAIPFQR